MYLHFITFDCLSSLVCSLGFCSDIVFTFLSRASLAGSIVSASCFTLILIVCLCLGGASANEYEVRVLRMHVRAVFVKCL